MIQFKGQKILVVEDNVISYKLIEAHLLRKNLTLVHATDGPEALEQFKSDPEIELVLMDIQLPSMSGLEVTRLIREFRPDVPIIATTANAYDEDRLACEAAGCTNFVTKPINFSRLLDLLKEYLH